MPRFFRFCLWNGLITLLCLAPAAALAQAETPSGETFWWNDRVFYQIFVRSFYDSDGDGMGDFQGLIQKLDYLNDGDPATTGDLGINGIWLMPVMPSPSEHGYDVTDYYGINPDYGSEADFRQFMDEAHKRGIAVIIDLVLNHTSDQHPWFVASQNGDPDYADYYVWSDTDPGFRGPDGQNVWHKKGDRYYYGLFYSGMPDLNYANPAVTAQMNDTARYWLEEYGVDGFRVDAVKYIVEEGRATENTPSTHAWLEAFHAYLRTVDPDALLVGEIWDSTPLVVPYVGGEMDIAFEFDLAGGLVRGASFGLGNTLLRALAPVLENYPPNQFATFLTNHDQDRFMSTAGVTMDNARLAGGMLLTLPGVPFVYYGEEIGMSGKRTTNSDNERRSPMQWDDTAGAGFTTGTPWFRVDPSAAEANVAAETGDPQSVLSTYRGLIQLRVTSPALQHGDFTVVTSASRKVLAFVRRSETQTVLVIINPDDQPITDYALSGTLPFTPVSTNVLYGGGTAAAPTVGADSTFADYTPLPELAPFNVSIIELLP